MKDVETKTAKFSTDVMKSVVDSFEGMLTDNSLKSFTADAEQIYAVCPLTAIKFALAMLVDPKIVEAVKEAFTHG